MLNSTAITTSIQLVPQQIYPTTTAHSRPSTLSITPLSNQQSTQYYNPTGVSNTPTYSALSLLATPSTPTLLTPNTVRTIEQSILQTLGEDAEESYMMESQQYSGNFVPPLPSSTSTITLINTWQGGQVSSDGVDNINMKQEIDETKPVIDEDDDEMMEDSRQVVKGRRKAQTRGTKPPAKPKATKAKATPPAKGGKKGRSGEEDERRRVRRERNKQAAARCRKRRVDHTNKLVEETEGLEAKKRSLQNQITELQNMKEELEFLLENHGCAKKSPSTTSMKCEVLSDLQNLPTTTRSSSAASDFLGVKPKRPNSLNVNASEHSIHHAHPLQHPTTRSLISTPAPPISISTPSNGITGLGFESLPDWANTPTPGNDDKGVIISGVVPAVPVTSDSGKDTGSLVTPVNPYKKLHDL